MGGWEYRVFLRADSAVLKSVLARRSGLRKLARKERSEMLHVYVDVLLNRAGLKERWVSNGDGRFMLHALELKIKTKRAKRPSGATKWRKVMSAAPDGAVSVKEGVPIEMWLRALDRAVSMAKSKHRVQIMEVRAALVAMRDSSTAARRLLVHKWRAKAVINMHVVEYVAMSVREGSLSGRVLVDDSVSLSTEADKERKSAAAAERCGLTALLASGEEFDDGSAVIVASYPEFLADVVSGKSDEWTTEAATAPSKADEGGEGEDGTEREDDGSKEEEGSAEEEGKEEEGKESV